jgi:chromodomain-helicase-DNA-binding protein 4
MDWENFKRAYEYFLTARDVKVPRLSAKLAKERDTRAQKKFTVLPQPNWAQPGTLMPFQVSWLPSMELSVLIGLCSQLEGITWLWQNWWNHRASILADEMGLVRSFYICRRLSALMYVTRQGKTVQIVTFIGRLVKERKTFPALVVVPNSTITNWVREFEKWAPGIRVVPYAGEAKARDIIRSYELQHPDGSWKYHVLIATYEAVTNPRDFNSIFKSVPRWEVLVIDEGQRRKCHHAYKTRRIHLPLSTVCSEK